MDVEILIVILTMDPLLQVLELGGQTLRIGVTVIEAVLIRIGLVDAIGPLEEELQMASDILGIGEEIGQTKIDEVAVGTVNQDVTNGDIGVSDSMGA